MPPRRGSSFLSERVFDAKQSAHSASTRSNRERSRAAEESHPLEHSHEASHCDSQAAGHHIATDAQGEGEDRHQRGSSSSSEHVEGLIQQLTGANEGGRGAAHDPNGYPGPFEHRESEQVPSAPRLKCIGLPDSPTSSAEALSPEVVIESSSPQFIGLDGESALGLRFSWDDEDLEDIDSDSDSGIDSS